MRAPHGYDAIVRFVGWNPGLYLPNLPAWERQMVLVKAPPGRSFFYDADLDGLRDANENSRGIRVHPQIARELEETLREVSEAELWAHVESCAGGYAFRLQREGEQLSCHAFGLAIDFGPKDNPLRRSPLLCDLGKEPGRGVVRIFQRRGWKWGGDWTRPDCMHLQFAHGY